MLIIIETFISYYIPISGKDTIGEKHFLANKNADSQPLEPAIC